MGRDDEARNNDSGSIEDDLLFDILYILIHLKDVVSLLPPFLFPRLSLMDPPPARLPVLCLTKLAASK